MVGGGAGGRYSISSAPERADGTDELIAADLARLVVVPLPEQVDHARAAAGQRISQRPAEVLVELDAARAVGVQPVEALAQLLVGVLALLALLYEAAELVECEHPVLVGVG